MVQLNPRYIASMVDANFLDLVVEGDPVALKIDGSECDLRLPHSVCSEVARPETPASIKAAASRYIHSVRVNLTPPEEVRLVAITLHFRGNAESSKHDSDAFHIFESQKYGCRYFITCDQRLISKANELTEETRVLAITPTDFVKLLQF